ncbi:DUF6599 family protein [Calditrichota bacterium]
MKHLLNIFCTFYFFTGNIFSSEINFSKIEGWTATDSLSVYTESNLWEYINGAADQFISYDFQELFSCEIYSGEQEAVIDVYNMGSRLNAFGIYKTERGDVSPKLAIGAEAVITSPMQCLMLKDMYYVKVNMYEGELSGSQAKKLLKSISDILPGKSTFPEELNLLPEEGKIPGTEYFVNESYLGMADLRHIVFADYMDDTESKFQYFIIIPKSENTPEIIWDKLVARWQPIEKKSFPILYKKIPYKGLIGVIKTNQGIIGVTDSADEVEMIQRLLNIVEQ